MLSLLKRWRERRILEHHPIAESDWRAALSGASCLQRLTASEHARLRVLATFLLHDKSLEPAQGLELTDAMRARLAAIACLPILNLGLHWYRDWHSIVLYPDLFVPQQEIVDGAGVVHRVRMPMEGEAWQRGPVILSWAGAASTGTPPGHNVVIHELAHKLDMLNGEANGFPPLHGRMSRRAWSKAFTHAFDALERQWCSGERPALDTYGLENPGEFFAVTSEAFFEAPRTLRDFDPELYRQLTLFYRQHPIAP